MSYYIRTGNNFTVSDDKAVDIHRSLPAGNYIIKQDSHGNLFLQSVDAFEHKGKVYGDTLRNVERILRTFNDRTNSTGVMLTGEQGSGKTLLAKMLSITAAQSGIPTIIINHPWCGDNFNKFIQDIDQPCIVMFDEFEKVYDNDEQESMLTLLDGVFPSKKLFILTTNDKWRVDSHMRNRPGRIFYMLDFNGLDAGFIREYCAENLLSPQYVDAIVRITSMFNQFNFDMLKALVEEMNRYGETPQEALRMLNVKVEFGANVSYNVEIKIPGKKLIEVRPAVWRGNPLSGDTMSFDYWEGEDSDRSLWTIEFDPKDLRRMDASIGKFTFVHDEGEVTLTRVDDRYNFIDLF